MTSSASERSQRIRASIAGAAEVLGNTPAVARSSYIDPTIFELYEKGEVMAPRGSPQNPLIQLLSDGRWGVETLTRREGRHPLVSPLSSAAG
ncbi:MAG: hypothetical protein ACOH1J_05060 [Microbacteriaceae bacterium]